MNEPLLAKQNFESYLQKANQLCSQVKEINDEIQATDENDFDKMKEVIDQSRTSQLNLAEELKNVFEKLEKLANLSEQKKKMKQLKDQYQKEINRYKTIQKNLIDQGYEIRRQTLHRRSTQTQFQQKKNQNVYKSNVTLNQSQMQEQQFEELVEIDQLEIDNAVIREKQEEINIIEKDALILNKIVNDMGREVDKQGQQLDVVEINMTEVKQNLKVVVKELDGAQVEQKKTLKKYLCLGGIALLVVLIICGIIAWRVIHNKNQNKNNEDS